MKEFVLFVKFFALYFWLCRTVLLTLITIIFVDGIIIAYLEGWSIFNSIYFVLITALTIGYGDITPETVLGRIMSIASGIVGVIIVGLIIAISELSLKNTIIAANKE